MCKSLLNVSKLGLLNHFELNFHKTTLFNILEVISSISLISGIFKKYSFDIVFIDVNQSEELL